MQQSFTTAQVAGMAGVHRDTLLRWLDLPRSGGRLMVFAPVVVMGEHR